ncbi:MAG: hypothetical protein K9W44_05555 [Candidatus Lokiarchaeota archaeon]|nr:hypothetical protein [Candidatus Harpocratesius repetitus]
MPDFEQFYISNGQLVYFTKNIAYSYNAGIKRSIDRDEDGIFEEWIERRNL